MLFDVLLKLNESFGGCQVSFYFCDGGDQKHQNKIHYLAAIYAQTMTKGEASMVFLPGHCKVV